MADEKDFVFCTVYPEVGDLVGMLNHTGMCFELPAMIRPGIEPCSEHSGMAQKDITGKITISYLVNPRIPASIPYRTQHWKIRLAAAPVLVR